jgi:hypothetical protein
MWSAKTSESVRHNHLRGGMKILSERIERELRAQTSEWAHCAIYEDELQRIWQLNDENRKAKIAQFAREHGFHLSFYKQGLCAIFVKEPGAALGNYR